MPRAAVFASVTTPLTKRLSQTALGGLLVVAYFLAGKLGLSFALVQASTSSVWPPTGIAIAGMLLLGRRFWPAILLGAFLVNITTTGSWVTSLAIAIGNTLEALLAATLMIRHSDGLSTFERASRIFRFALFAALLSTSISATIGVTALSIAGQSSWDAYGLTWLTWWLGNGAGAITVTPLLVLWARRPKIDPQDRPLEMAAMLLVTTGLSALIFLGGLPIPFLFITVLTWAAFRFQQREVATALVIMALAATMATAKGTGPFVASGYHPSLLILQAFIGTLGITMLAISAFMGEHRKAIRDAESANRSKDQFLAMLSHELRNPLQAIGSATAILRTAPSNEAAIRKATEIIERQGTHLSRLVEDLLDFTRVIEGKSELKRRPVDLSEIVSRCVSTLEATGQTSSHSIELALEHAWISGDPDRLAQIVTNLLSNALRYTPAGGSVRIATTAVEDQCSICVHDNGIGIPADLMPHIFEPFTQGERTLDRRQGGLGIGLTLVRDLVALHGGTVGAASKGSGLGSEFVVRFPALPPPASTPQQHIPAAATYARRILIVEDNADARDGLRSLLEALGHQVLEAPDGRSGVTVALKEELDVALIDIGLPELDGYGVATEIRSAGRRIKLIALTGYGQPKDVVKSRQAGFDLHLTKPTTVDALVRAIA